MRYSMSNRALLKQRHFIFFNLLTYSIDQNMRHMFREKNVTFFVCIGAFKLQKIYKKRSNIAKL